ncbi:MULTISPECIES: glycogen debranching N-terminal domain-containing protein [unclassified Streptomyces]|uniref:amylo-alpha-1,6-glucosidase n=1 Tax=unclassified Streptomyces TaxID=2593676 RepID=UPI00069C7430|nr:glycogen debranching N-terminal domain-containing protein [Streptomyces sp. CNQ-509]
MTDWIPQPFIHDAIICVGAPELVLSPRDGQIRGGAEGFYAADSRLISRLVLSVNGQEPEIVDAWLSHAGEAHFLAVHRDGDDPTPDPTVTVERVRTAGRDFERITVSNHRRRDVRLALRLSTACDLSDMSEVRAGRPREARPATESGRSIVWTSPGKGAVTLTGTPAPDRVEAGRHAAAFVWDVELAPAQTWTTTLALDTTPGTVSAPPAAVVAPRPGRQPWSAPRLTCTDPRLTRLIDQSLNDLAALLLADPQARDDRFLAAGVPWYLTLFGRDSLWAARMMLPLGTELAAGTLRSLARRQGTTHDAATEEQPGKIMHELRREASAVLPPLYYGTIDATLLFVTVLAEAWHWGMPESEVAALLPAAERALDWLREHADADGDGFVEYARLRETGLVNQGWKDSEDAVQSTAARLAKPPIALAEVQGYAYEAARAGAQLLTAFGRPGADYWREWAEQLAGRFRSAFWLEDDLGPYVAIALDGQKRPVDAVASNMGHLPGTGILSQEECRLVARRLSRADMDSGWGLRTMSANARGFNPFGYHTGSVWAHDTAIAVAGLAATGNHQAAASLMDGLVEAASAFDYRLPELYAGEQRRAGGRPAPYPASCRPQAWAATAGVSLLTSLLGLRPDLPAGRIRMRPLTASPVGALEVSGIRLGSSSVTVTVDGRGHGDIVGLPLETRVETGD